MMAHAGSNCCRNPLAAADRDVAFNDASATRAPPQLRIVTPDRRGVERIVMINHQRREQRIGFALVGQLLPRE